MLNGAKTLVGVLASHDSPEKNKALANVLDDACSSDLLRSALCHFRFIFTGGTYRRLFHGEPTTDQGRQPVTHKLAESTKRFLHHDCGVFRLPSTRQGGVTMLGTLVTQRKVSILWPFFSPLTTHLLYPENLALLRLADQWRVKKLMNSGSVKEWLHCEAERDKCLNIQESRFEIKMPSDVVLVAETHALDPNWDPVQHDRSSLRRRMEESLEQLPCEAVELPPQKLAQATVALISHDEMKSRMVDFVIDYEHELERFGSILATGTTGRLIKEAAPSLSDKVHLYHSGPKGGDIEIATEILFGGCHVVIFFVDPLHPHPHTEDIRVVFGACMIQDEVRILSNEVQARAWMDRRVRGT
jgi:methylglyoxal synthase